MRKTLFSVLPLLVFLGPTYAGLTSFFGLSLAPKVGHVEPNYLRGRRAANPAAERLRARIADAKLALKDAPADANDFVTLAVDGGAAGGPVQLVKLAKTDFMAKGAETSVLSDKGETLKVKVVRPNYVNTAVRVTDSEGKELRPLVVRYPVEREGKLDEVAYYTSAHPAVEEDDVVRAGGDYVREQLDESAAALAAKGEQIDPAVVDVAERLCHVEHTDHKRFLTEDAASLFKEIRALYALNAGDTYRYSVSSAGAGGMVQMIPPTYKAIREQHPEAELKEDFVEGMRDHANATRAMLLYMQDTWDRLRKSDEVAAALDSGEATQAELLAAGYNSNPLRLPKYLARGGSNWRTLIPEETKMYLRIYAAVESNVDFKGRS
jgi:hypothetical protein